MYCITRTYSKADLSTSEVYYLAWQEPAWDESGYFFTTKEVMENILYNNTPEHPFLFNTIPEAVEFLKKQNFSLRYKILKWNPS